MVFSKGSYDSKVMAAENYAYHHKKNYNFKIYSIRDKKTLKNITDPKLLNGSVHAYKY